MSLYDVLLSIKDKPVNNELQEVYEFMENEEIYNFRLEDQLVIVFRKHDILSDVLCVITNYKLVVVFNLAEPRNKCSIFYYTRAINCMISINIIGGFTYYYYCDVLEHRGAKRYEEEVVVGDLLPKLTKSARRILN